MMKALRLRQASIGMTLVELMVGMAVGLFVATVAIATFVSTRTLNVVNASTTRMSENARLAMDLLHTDLRSSGFAGCWPLAQRRDEPPLSVLNGTVDDGFITNESSGLLGFKGGTASFSPALPTLFNKLETTALPGSKKPVFGSDVVSVRVPADTVSLGVISSMASLNASPQVKAATAGNLISKGDIVLIANCETSAIFQVTEDNPAATGVLSHAVGNGSARSNNSTDLPKTYRSDATVYRLETHHYYVAPSALPDRPNSLWRLEVSGVLKPQDGVQAVEIANGIENIRVSYGVDSVSPPSKVVRYLDADAVTDWGRVLSARIEMVAVTTDDNLARVKATGAADRRLRNTLTEIVTLRNGAP